jgi:hypothetical protein
VAGSITDAFRIFGANLLILTLYAAGCVAMAIIQRWRGDAPSATGNNRELIGQLATGNVSACSCSRLADRHMLSVTGWPDSLNISTRVAGDFGWVFYPMRCRS